MGRFQGFYTGEEVAEENVNFSEDDAFAKRQQKQENTQTSKRQLNVWRVDLSKCSSISDYRRYVQKYDRPDNPYIVEAKQKIDDLTFSNCKSIEDYKAYLSSFPSGRNSTQAKSAIRRLQTKPSTPSSSYTSSSYTSGSHSSNISGEDIWGFVKKVIGVIAILIGVGLIYLWFTDKITSRSVIAGYCICIAGPICKWAFDD